MRLTQPRSSLNGRGNTAGVISPCLSGDAKGREWRVRVWDAETGETILGPLVLTYVEAAVYSPDETMIATGGWAEDIRFIKIWNVNTGCNTLCGICGEVANEMDEYGYSGLEQMATSLGKRRQREGDSSLGKRRKRDKDVLQDPSSYGSTLFVSNLPFDATSTDLQTTFSDLAPVRYAFVVQKQGTGESKGFGYVSFSIREDAQTAFDTASTEGISINKRKLRVRWADKKDKGKSSSSKEGLSKEPQEKNAKLENGNEGDVGNVKLDDIEDIAAEPSDTEEDEEQLGLHEDDHGDGDNDNDDENDDENDDDEDDISDEERDSDDVRPTKPQLPQTDTGTTLFIRNIPFEATEDELRTLFRAYGPLRYARITIDHETERSRGTGFVCFWQKEVADSVIEQSEILRTETMGTQHQPQKNPFTLPSILTPDPSAGVAKNLVLHGRTLDCVRAVTREEAGKLKEEGEKRREKADKRNLYLLREGVILPNTPAASTIPPVELEKRTNSFNARRTMLRTNPSLYVSKTRLSVRQIPLWASERTLRRLATHAIREFEAEVKKGERIGLTPDELAEDVKEAEDTGTSGTKPKAGKRSQGIKSKGVKQAKIVRQQDRVDPVTGKGRSKGYGFVEMPRHADSLRVLRWANNNSDVGSLLSGEQEP
ncbi:RNA-binding domain-containing protein [Rhizopogon salebrosus TDB-379]|nr:RNA-binding domain-containing protein [Rhizopogon salebrosus TDB-379]